MPIVRDLARNSGFVDQAFCTPSRNNAGNPNGLLTPAFAGEIVLDTTNNTTWKAETLATTSWVAQHPF